MANRVSLAEQVGCQRFYSAVSKRQANNGAFAELRQNPALGRAEAFRRSMRNLVANGHSR